MIGDNCSSACPTRDHATFGECLRSKSIRLGPIAPDHNMTHEKKLQSELADYKEARLSGMQPDGTTRAAVEKAQRTSEKEGEPYRADARPEQVMKQVLNRL